MGIESDKVYCRYTQGVLKQAAESRLLTDDQGCCVHLYGIYGQGMTSASLAAMMLNRCLKQVQSKPLNGFLLRHKQLANILHTP